MLDGAYRAFARRSFDVWASLDVKFAGEEGVDDGGPMREFLRLASIAVQNLKIFGGEETNRMLVLDYGCKSSQYFFQHKNYV